MASPVYMTAFETLFEEAVSRYEEKEEAWGDSWNDGTYTNNEVMHRLLNAVDALRVSLDLEKKGTVGIEIVRKNAADVMNQAIFAAGRTHRG